MKVNVSQQPTQAAAKRWIASRIRMMRHRLGFTQEQLGSLIDVDRTRISDIEAARYDLKFSTIVRLCNACGVSIEEFFKGSRKGIEQEQFLEV